MEIPFYVRMALNSYNHDRYAVIVSENISTKVVHYFYLWMFTNKKLLFSKRKKPKKVNFKNKFRHEIFYW